MCGGVARLTIFWCVSMSFGASSSARKDGGSGGQWLREEHQHVRAVNVDACCDAEHTHLLPADKCKRRRSVRCTARAPPLAAGEGRGADAWSRAGSRRTAAASAEYLGEKVCDEGEGSAQCAGANGRYTGTWPRQICACCRCSAAPCSRLQHPPTTSRRTQHPHAPPSGQRVCDAASRWSRWRGACQGVVTCHVTGGLKVGRC